MSKKKSLNAVLDYVLWRISSEEYTAILKHLTYNQLQKLRDTKARFGLVLEYRDTRYKELVDEITDYF